MLHFKRSEVARVIADVTGRSIHPILTSLENKAMAALLSPAIGGEGGKMPRFAHREVVRAYVLLEIHSFGVTFADLARLNEKLNAPIMGDDFTPSPGVALDEIIEAAQTGKDFSIFVRMGMESGAYAARFSFAARNARVDATLDLMSGTTDAATLRTPAATLAGEILMEVMAEAAAAR